LLALADDTFPETEDLAGLRRALRPVLLQLLGGRALKSWDLIGDLARLAPKPQA
jgi:DNA repair protein RecO (recombination protein O)